ncbi:hypothetical protein ES708_11474 [subsurface metagenome]
MGHGVECVEFDRVWGDQDFLGQRASEVIFALVGTIIGYYFGTKERTKE